MIVPRGPHLGVSPRQLVTYVGRPLLLLLLYDLAVVCGYRVLHWQWVSLPHIPLALFGSAIGVILGFRNNSSYARWWEARTIWGSIVNNSRSWARQVVTNLHPATSEELDGVRSTQRELVYLQIGAVHALRQQLRGLPALEPLAGLLGAEQIETLSGERSIPLALQMRQGRLLRECQTRGWLDPLQWSALDATLNDLADAQGASERIKNTPMPKQYDYLPQLFVQIYCLVLPLALVQNMGWLTPLGSTLVGFIFLALDKIGRDLEDPFDNSIYDIPLTSMSRTIEINLRQALGETELPEPEKAVDGVLW